MVLISELPSDVDARFLSFLEKDNSFLTPWSWDSKASKDESNPSKEKEYISIHRESYFSYEIIGRKGSNNNKEIVQRMPESFSSDEVNYIQASLFARSYSHAWYPDPFPFYAPAPFPFFTPAPFLLYALSL